MRLVRVNICPHHYISREALWQGRRVLVPDMSRTHVGPQIRPLYDMGTLKGGLTNGSICGHCVEEGKMGGQTAGEP